jgi:predicted amidohydrolase
MSHLKIALVVPDYTHAWDDDRQFRLSDLRQTCNAGAVDLVVFPEGYECVPVDEARDTLAWWASALRVPVLMGVEADGYQLAVYHNPRPQGDETSQHLYVKHSTAGRLAYEWPGYQGAADPMFHPIRLKGECLGVHICHDMYYGLVGHRLLGAGSRVLIDLTAGNVILAKWRNIVRARSLEAGGPFLCTMGYDPERGSGRTAGLAYRAGRPIVPVSDRTGPGGVGGYVIIDIDGPVNEDSNGDQPYTENLYTDIRLSLGTGSPADVSCRLQTQGITIGGAGACEGYDRWLGFTNSAGKIGVLPLALSELADGRAVHLAGVPEGVFDHHLLLYHASDPPSRINDNLSLMKLRAIEHRVGVAMLAGGVREVVKTNRYKSIQRFVERDGVFGLNAEFLGGTWSTAGTTSFQGVPRRWFSSYLSLLQ